MSNGKCIQNSIELDRAEMYVTYAARYKWYVADIESGILASRRFKKRKKEDEQKTDNNRIGRRKSMYRTTERCTNNVFNV